MFRDPRGLLRDERGARSAARVLLMAVVGYVLILILGDALGWIAQYVGPQLGGVAAAVAAAARRNAGTDDRFKDDER